VPDKASLRNSEEFSSTDMPAAPGLAAARATLFRWAEVISSGHLEDVLALYAPDAILVPTVSDEIRGQETERRHYFKTFLERKNLRCTIASLKKRISHKLGTVVIGGLYTFSFETTEGEETVPARFLFTFEEINGQWLITGHHSSRLSASV
jgi:hypothetical protein